MSNPAFPPEDERIRALLSYDILDTPPEPAFDDLTRLAASCLEVPVALISLVDRDRQWFKSKVGLAIDQTPRSVAFCDVAIRSESITVVEDAQRDPRFAGNPLVSGQPGIRFYAGAPLVTEAGDALGTLCVIDWAPRELTEFHRSTLAILARQVVDKLELRKRNAALSAALEQLCEQQGRLKRLDGMRRETEHRYEMLFANSMDGVLQTRPDGRILAANPAACTMLGLTEAQVCSAGRSAVLDTGDPRLAPLLAERARAGRARGELTMIRGNGDRFEVDIASSVYPDRDGQPIAGVVFRDITDRQVWAMRLQESLDLLNNLAGHVPGVIYQYRLYPDGRSCFPFASKGIWDIYEVTPEQIRDDASLVFQRLHPDDVESITRSIAESAASLQPWRHEYRVILPGKGLGWRLGDAQPERLGDGSVLWHGFITDVTERKQSEAEIQQLAYFDALTGLPNRRLLLDRIGLALASAQRSGRGGALLFIDLDQFKRINDARGHSVGDILLNRVAQRLLALMRSQDTVARLGGDEFVVLAGDLGPDPAAAALAAVAVAEKIRDALESPHSIDGYSYSSTGSIGITLFPKQYETVDDLLREADTAMYRAKEEGRNRIAFFEAGMQAEVAERLALGQDLKAAVADGMLRLCVQSQFDAGGAPSGGELLLRWQHPVHGNVPPSRFIPIAEESGLILTIGDWVVREACQALVRLRSAGSDLSLSVNVSPRQFRNSGFVDTVRRSLAETGAPASGLILEVTEGLLIEHWGDTLARMSELVAMGIRFSIDDFGTGYSSLAYLKKLPLYELKIDRSFVLDTPHNSSDTAIVQSIISVAAHLGLRVVAEGVETREQAAFLAASGCGVLQGFLFARPEPMAAWLAGMVRTGSRPG